MIKKEQVGRNFTKGAAAYDANAVIQRACATTLTALIRAHVEPKDVRTVCEIGCGTGFISEFIVATFPDADFILTDLSDGMLGRCEARLSTTTAYRAGRVRLVAQDGERLDAAGLDLIVSGLAFQWFENLPAAIARYHSLLKEGGVLAFSILTAETFKQLRESFAEAGSPFPGPSLPTQEQVENSLRIFSKTFITHERHPEKHPSTIHFLRCLRSIGAGNPGRTRPPVGALRRAIHTHERRAGKTEGDLTFEYHVTYGVCVR